MSIDHIWAPWRLEYVRATEPEPGCVFCNKPALADDRSALIVHRGKHCYVILNAFPYNPGHLMVVPFDHVPALGDLELEARNELMELTERSIRALTAASAPEGFNIGINQGVAAGAGIAAHLHQHVVPRWPSDTNFMPVIGEVRVLPEALLASYDKLVSTFASTA